MILKHVSERRLAVSDAPKTDATPFLESATPMAAEAFAAKLLLDVKEAKNNWESANQGAKAIGEALFRFEIRLQKATSRLLELV